MVDERTFARCTIEAQSRVARVRNVVRRVHTRRVSSAVERFGARRCRAFGPEAAPEDETGVQANAKVFSPPVPRRGAFENFFFKFFLTRREHRARARQCDERPSRENARPPVVRAFPENGFALNRTARVGGRRLPNVARQ